MVLIPSFCTGWWVLYAWDLFGKKIHVLDPVLTNKDVKMHLAMHEKTLDQLHEAICVCKDRLFYGWDEKVDGYDVLIHQRMNKDVPRYLYRAECCYRQKFIVVG